MKKFLISLLAMILVVSNVLAFAACDTGSHDHETESKTETKVETDKETEKPGHTHTDKPTEKPTEKTTEKPTEAPKPTETETSGSTDKETGKATETKPISGTVTENESETKAATESETVKKDESETVNTETEANTESETVVPSTSETVTETVTEDNRVTESETESSDASDEECDHVWSDWTVDTEATCVTKGSRSRECSECGDIDKEEIPFTDHKGGEATCTRYANCSECGKSYGTLKAHEWIEASCTQAKHCKNCTETEGDPLGHTGGAATCTELAKCSVCGNKYGELEPHKWLDANCTQPKRCENCSATEGKPLGHSGGEATCKDLARCEKCGEKYGSLADHTWIEADCDEPRHCDVCGEKEGEKLEHTGGTATCTELAVCSECGQKYGELAPHVWNDATCTSPKSCKNCSETEGAPAGHKGGEATCTELAVCSVCSNKYGELKGHDWVEASCTEPKHCNDCSAIDGVALGHTGGEATCTALAVCTRCGNGYGSYLSHSFTSKNTDSAYLSTHADCDSPAYYFYSCACGLRGEEKFANGEALGHKYTYISNGDGTHTYVCANDETHTGSENCSGGEATCIDKAVCDFCKEEYGESKGHDWNLGGIPLSAGSEETACTTPIKNTYYCSDCDATKVEITPAPGHKYDSNVVDPTCAAGGYTEHTCSVCGDYYTDNSTEATDAHSWNADRTCTVGHVCSECGKTEAALGHSHVLADTKAATCTESAKNIYECSTCFDSYEVVTAPANGHDLTDVKPVETELGSCAYLQKFECKTCHTLIDGETVYHHKYTATIPEGKEANCHTEGEKKYDCSECGHSYTEKIKVDPTAHVWDGGVKNDSTITYSCTVDGCSETKSVIDASDKDEADVNVSDLSAGGVEFNEATLDVSGLTGTDVLAGSDKVTLAAGTLKDETLDAVKGALTEEEKKQLGDNPIYNFSMMDGDTPITSFGDNYVTVTIPYTLAEGEDVDSIAVWYIDGTELVSIKATYSNGYITFKTNHFSYYSVTRLTPKQRCALYGHSETYTTVAPTCTDEGYTLVLCIRCAATSKKDIVPALGHEYTSYTEDPSCTTAGKTVFECSTCNHSYFDVIPATGHTYTVEKTDATCSAEGSEIGTCACGDSYTNIIPKLPHVTTATVVKPTCEADGYTLHECNNCDYSYTDSVVSAIGHKLTDSWEWSKDHKTATVTLTCLNECGFIHTKTLEATENNVEANCLKNGKTEFTIKYVYNGETFSDSYVEKKAKTEHVYEDTWKHNKHGHWHKCRDCSGQSERFDHEFDRDNGIVTKIATCVSEGEITYACFCGETITEKLPVTEGHRYVDNVCIDCGEKKPCEHKYNGGEITTPPTCTADGVKTYTCFACGETKTEKVPSVKHHTFDEGVVTLEPSCTEEGTKTFTCIYCSETKTEVIPSHKGHSFDDGEIILAPSCLSTGTRVYTCKRCGTNKEETIPSLGGHSFDEGTVVREATCLKDGLLIYTCYECGETKNEIIPSLGDHEFDDGVVRVEPSCEKDGLKVFTCGKCGETKTEVISSFGGHTYNKGEIKYEPTCTNEGLIIYTCENCGMTEKEIIPSLGGHKFDDGKTTSEPTCTENGIKTYTCATCGETKTERIPSLGGHTFGEGKTEKEPTCIENGMLIYTCSVCGDVKNERIPATGEHIFVGGVCQTCGHKDGECEHKDLYEKIIDLTEYGACSGTIRVYTCDCGAVTIFDPSFLSEEVEGGCIFEEIEESYETDEDNNMIAHMVVGCEKCGITVTVNATMTPGTCYMSASYVMDVSIGETDILKGATYDTESESHSVAPQVFDLSEYSTCGGYIEAMVCRNCGKITEYNYSEIPCYGETICDSYTDDNGFEHYVDSFKCEKCGTTYTFDTYTYYINDCSYQDNTTLTISHGDEILFTASKYSYHESHDHEVNTVYHGDTCNDGYTTTYTCKNCGDSYEEHGSGHRSDFEEINLREYFSCGGYVEIEKCKVCGLTVNFWNESGNCKLTNYESFEKEDEDGNIRYFTVASCEMCGTTHITERWIGRVDKCINAQFRKVSYQAKSGEIMLEITSENPFSMHEYTYEYEMNGESCYDGYTERKICGVCGVYSESYFDYHNTTETYYYLDKDDECPGGYVCVRKCPCGEESHVYWDIPYGATEFSYYTDEFGVKHTVATTRCLHDPEKCIIIVADSYYTYVDGCEAKITSTYSITIGGETVASGIESELYTSMHVYEISDVELLGDSCENGVRVKRICSRCGTERNEEFYHHESIYIDRTTFSEYGVCDGHYFETSKCACGEFENYYSDLFALESSDNTYICDKCSLSISVSTDEGIKDCVSTVFTSIDAKIGDTTLNLYTMSTSNVKHSYTASVEFDDEGRMVIKRTCSGCSNTYSDTYIPGEFAQHEDGFFFELELNPEENGQYFFTAQINNYCSMEVYVQEKDGLMQICYGDGYNFIETVFGVQAGKSYFIRVYPTPDEATEMTYVLTSSPQSCYHDDGQVEINGLISGAVSCEDGYYRVYVCPACGYFTGLYTGNDHSISLDEYFDLSYSGVCGGMIRIYKCACGRDGWTDWELYCPYENEITEYVGKDGIRHRVEAYFCSDCGVRVEFDYYNLRDECYIVRYCDFTVTVNGETVYEASTIDDRYQHHDIEVTYTLHGTSCTDGVTATYGCKYCDYVENEDYFEWHVTIITSSFDFSQIEGVCEWHYFETYSCPCGQDDGFHTDMYGMEYNETDDVYVCSECGLQMKNTVTETRDGCTLITNQRIDAILGDVYSVLDVTTTDEYHNVSVSASTDADGNIVITGICADCGITKSVSPSTVTLASGEEGYYYDLEFTPDEDGRYVIYSMASGDTYVELYTVTADGLEYISSDDDGGNNGNFRLDYQLTATTSYIFRIRFYSWREGSIRYVFEKADNTCNHNTGNKDFAFLCDGSESCTDGVYIGSVCPTCCSVLSFNESTSHEYVVTDEFNLTEHGACGGSITVSECICGQQTDVSYTWNCEMTHESGWYHGDDDVVHRTSTYSCQICGLAIVEDSYDIQEGCYRYMITDTTVSIGDEVIYTHSRRTSRGENHTFDYSFELKGDDCEDGYTMISTCKFCGYSYSSERTGHSTYNTNIDLGQYELCGGYVEYYTCACGQNSGFNWSLDCNYSCENEQITVDGIVYNVYTYTCEDCGIVIRSRTYELHEGCFINYYCDYTVTVGDTVIVSEFKYVESRYDNHKFAYDFVLNGESCKDGYTVTEYCTVCDYSYSYENSNHTTFVIEHHDLSELGACGGGYVSIYECPCGEYRELQYNGYCWNNATSDSYTDDNGIEHYVYTYFCPDCGLTLVRDEYREKVVCTVTDYCTYTISIGDETIVDSYTCATSAYVEHTYTYTVELLGNDCTEGILFTYTCSDCGDSYTRERSTHMITESQIVDLSEYGACAGSTVEFKSCPCGYSKSFEYRLSGCSYRTNSDNYFDEDDILHSVRTYTCSNCGLVVAYDAYSVKENCEKTTYRTYTVYIGEEEIIPEYKLIYSSSVDHDFAYTFELEGETCDSGYTVTYTCRDCGTVETYSGYYHRYYPIATYNLKDFGGCKGSKIVYSSCACGHQQKVDFSAEYCNLGYTEDTFTDEDGITHNIRAYTCRDCGLVYSTESYSVKEGCYVCSYRIWNASINGTVVLEETKYLSSKNVDHNYEYTYTLEGATCEDGVKVTYVCVDCGYEDSYTENYHMYCIETVTDLTEYGACGGTITTTQCLCGAEIEHNVDVNCTRDYRTTEYVDSDDVLHSVNTHSCPDCGLRYVMDSYEIKSNCLRNEYTSYSVYVGDTAIITDYVVSRGVYDSHDFVYTYELHGESCDDGYTVSYKCKDCDYSNSYEDYGHYTQEEQRFELARYGACGGYFTISTCPCGENIYVGHNFLCNSTGEHSNFTTDGITYERYVETCKDCGLVYSYTSHYVVEGCFTKCYTTVSISVGETAVVENYEYVSSVYAHHNYITSFQMNGGSCEDGYLATFICEDCSHTYEREYSAHNNFTLLRYDLVDYGACGGYVEVRGCPCGQLKYINYSLGCSYVADFERTTDADGIFHEIRTYTCDTCGLNMVIDLYSIKENCQLLHYITFDLSIGDNELMKDFNYLSSTETSHNYELAFDLSGDSCEDGYTVTYTCTDCTNTYTTAEQHHNTYLMESYDLSDYGACGDGYVNFYSCPCGKMQNAEFELGGCDYDRTDNTFEDEDGKLITNTTYSCDTCGARITRTYYNVLDYAACETTTYYTLMVNVGTTAICKLEYQRFSTTHDYKIEAVLDVEDGDCTNGVTFTHTCRSCGDTYSYRRTSHTTYQKENIEIDNVCGGYITVTGCACGYSTSVNIYNSLCEYDVKSVDPWVDNIVPSGYYEVNGHNTHVSNTFYTYTCAVTDPEQCAFKIRYASYYQYTDDCIAEQFVIYQIGYDEATGTCDREIRYSTGKKVVCHNYTTENVNVTNDDGSKVSGTVKTCSCGTRYSVLSYFNENGVLVKSEQIYSSALENEVAKLKYYEYVHEYMGEYFEYIGNPETHSSYKVIQLDGYTDQHSYDYEYDFSFTAPFGDHSFVVIETYTANDGSVRVQERARTFYKDHSFSVHEYTTYNAGSENEYWHKYDYTYNFEGACRRTTVHTSSYGDNETTEDNFHVSTNYTVLKDNTCTQHGAYAYVCVICGHYEYTYEITPDQHSWYKITENHHICTICGLENANGASGEIVMEDFTAKYGNGENYVVGYWNRDNVDFIYYVSLILHTPLEDGNDEIVLQGIGFTELTDIRAIAFSKSAVEEAALALGYTSDMYDVRFAFVPIGSDSSFDYAITFTENTNATEITDSTTITPEIGAGEELILTINPSVSGTWVFTSVANGDTLATLYDDEGVQLTYNDDSGYNTNFKITYNLTAGNTYTIKVRWIHASQSGTMPIIISAPTVG